MTVKLYFRYEEGTVPGGYPESVSSTHASLEDAQAQAIEDILRNRNPAPRQIEEGDSILCDRSDLQALADVEREKRAAAQGV